MNADKKIKKYEEISEKIFSVLKNESDEIAKMATISCLLSEMPHFFWTGFYRKIAENELVVGPYLGTLGCLRIPFSRGVCGAAAREQKTILVPDTHQFPGHIACDSRSKSEIVVPVFDAEKNLIAVFDVDSTEKNAFDKIDQKYLESILEKVFSKKESF